MRYWWSEGSTRFDIDSTRLSPAYGSPTSTLIYDGVNVNSFEFFFAVRNETQTFFKGFIGGGWLSGGCLDDEDYAAGQLKFSDTYSKIDGDGTFYVTLDVGQDFDVGYGDNLVVSPFVGFNYWEESMSAYGARCNPDQLGGVFCGPPGSMAAPFGTKVINRSMWSSLRLGTEITARLLDRLTFRGDAAFLPAAYLLNEDSHSCARTSALFPISRTAGQAGAISLKAN